MLNPKALRGYYLKCSVVFFLMCRSVSVGLSWSTAWFPGHVHQLQGCACWGTCTMAPMGSSLMGRLTWAKIQTLQNFSHRISPYFHFSVEKAVCISRSWIGFWLHARLTALAWAVRWKWITLFEPRALQGFPLPAEGHICCAEGLHGG